MEIIVSIFVIFIGLYLLIGALLRWDWMYQNRRARGIVQIFGTKGARIIYGTVGLIVALSIPVFRVIRWIDLYQKNVQGNGRDTIPNTILAEPTADFAVTLSVEPDGCTVTRSEVTGSSTVYNLQWTITNESGDMVLGRNALGEYRYQYYRPGVYSVVLQTWHNGQYIDIGNEVKIDCQ